MYRTANPYTVRNRRQRRIHARHRVLLAQKERHHLLGTRYTPEGIENDRLCHQLDDFITYMYFRRTARVKQYMDNAIPF